MKSFFFLFFYLFLNLCAEFYYLSLNSVFPFYFRLFSLETKKNKKRKCDTQKWYHFHQFNFPFFDARIVLSITTKRQTSKVCLITVLFCLFFSFNFSFNFRSIFFPFVWLLKKEKNVQPTKHKIGHGSIRYDLKHSYSVDNLISMLLPMT